MLLRVSFQSIFSLYGSNKMKSPFSSTFTLVVWILALESLKEACYGFQSHHYLKNSAKGSGAMAMEMNEKKRTEHPYVTIVGSGPKAEVLPFAYANNPVWIFDPEESEILVSVPDSPQHEDQWVDPKSFNDLWIPEDSPAPFIRPALTVLLKDGNPRYVMPGLDIYLEKNGSKWRNRGLHSFPMAHAWQTFLAVPPELLHVSLYVNEKIPDTINDAWVTIAEQVAVSDKFEDIVNMMADPPVEIQKGFHYVTFPCSQIEAIQLPRNSQQIKLFLNDLEDPIRLLEIEGVSTGGGVLDVTVAKIASAAKSEYIPTVYKELFQSSS